MHISIHSRFRLPAYTGIPTIYHFLPCPHNANENLTVPIIGWPSHDYGGAGLEVYKFQFNKDGTIKWVIKNPLETGFFRWYNRGYGGKSEVMFQEFLNSDYSDPDPFYTSEYKGNFDKGLPSLLTDDFTSDKLSEGEMDSIENQLNKK